MNFVLASHDTRRLVTADRGSPVRAEASRDSGWSLACPDCGERLRDGRSPLPEYGLLSCDCARYPVVAGIPVLLRGRLPGTACTVEELADLVRQGRHEDALLAATTPGSSGAADLPRWHRFLFPQAVAARIQRRRRAKAVAGWARLVRELAAGGGPDTRDLIQAYFDVSGGTRHAADYFIYRFGQPRHLAALAVAGRLDPEAGPVLDLGCGAGHVARHLRGRFGAQSVVGVDLNFFLLLLARTRIAPGAEFVCCDIERDLPFPDASFGSAIASNVLHFLGAKRHAVAELERVVAPGGMVGVCSLRQRYRPHATANLAMSPSGYLRLFRRTRPRLFLESDVLQRSTAASGDPFGRRCDEDAAEQADLLTILACEDWTAQDEVHGEDWLALEHPALNPLYSWRETRADGSVHAHLESPSPLFRAENIAAEPCLPVDVELPAEVVNALRQGRWLPAMRSLAARGVVVDLPKRY